MKNHMNIVIDRYELAETKWEIKYLNRIYIYIYCQIATTFRVFGVRGSH